MANIIISKEKRWLGKPPLGTTINYGHPLSRGLVGCWLMNEGGGNIVGDVARKNDGINNGAVWNPTKTGVGLKFNGTSDFVNMGNKPSLDLVKNFTFVANFYALVLPPLTSGAKWFLGKDTNTGRSYDFGLWKRDDNSQVNLALQSSGNIVDGVNGGSNTAIIVDSKWHQGSVSYDGAKTSYYFDGKSDGVRSGVNDPTITTTNLCIGKRLYPSYNEWFNGYLSYVYIYNRVLSPSEIQQLYAEPYCFIKPYKRTSYFIIGGAIDVIVTPNVLTARIVPIAPTIVSNADVTITPNAISNRIIVQSPTIKIDAVITPNVITARVTSQTPTVKIDAIVSTNTLSNRILTQSPSVRIDALISINTLSSRIITQSPTIKTDAAMALSVLQARLALYAPTIAVSVAVTGIADVIRLASAMEKIITRQSQMSKTITKKSRMDTVIDLDSPLH